MCSEACAEMLGLTDAHRFDPCVLQAFVKYKSEINRNKLQ